jgi:hypothetical protein
MSVPKVKNVRVLDGQTLVVTFTNGQKKKYDMTELFKRDMFTPLKNPAFFKNVYIETGGHAVAWNKDIDISEYELWKNGELCS